MCEARFLFSTYLKASIVTCAVIRQSHVIKHERFSGVNNNVRLVLGCTQNCSWNVLLTVRDKIRLTKPAGDVDSAHVQNTFRGQKVAIRLSTTPYLFAVFPHSRIDMTTKIMKCFSVGLLSRTHVRSPRTVVLVLPSAFSFNHPQCYPPCTASFSRRVTIIKYAHAVSYTHYMLEAVVNRIKIEVISFAVNPR